MTARPFRQARPSFPTGLSALQEPVAYGELVRALLFKDLKARYQAQGLGYLWSLLNPLLLLAVYAVVFSWILPVDMPGFAVFLASGLLPWLWFSNSLGGATTSVLAGSSLLRRVYFPAQVLPLVVVLSQLVHFLLSLPILIAFALLYDVAIGVTWFAIIPIVVVQFPFTLGLALICAAWTVRFRDLEYLIGNVLNMWFFFTPIIYPPELLPERFRWLLVVNPMAVLSRAYQEAAYAGRWPEIPPLLATLGVGLVVLSLGAVVFDSRRWRFAEEV